MSIVRVLARSTFARLMLTRPSLSTVRAGREHREGLVLLPLMFSLVSVFGAHFAFERVVGKEHLEHVERRGLHQRAVAAPRQEQRVNDVDRLRQPRHLDAIGVLHEEVQLLRAGDRVHHGDLLQPAVAGLLNGSSQSPHSSSKILMRLAESYLSRIAEICVDPRADLAFVGGVDDVVILGVGEPDAGDVVRVIDVVVDLDRRRSCSPRFFSSVSSQVMLPIRPVPATDVTFLPLIGRRQHVVVREVVRLVGGLVLVSAAAPDLVADLEVLERPVRVSRVVVDVREPCQVVRGRRRGSAAGDEGVDPEQRAELHVPVGAHVVARIGRAPVVAVRRAAAGPLDHPDAGVLEPLDDVVAHPVRVRDGRARADEEAAVRCLARVAPSAGRRSRC